MTRATFDVGAKMRRWKEACANPRPALKQIGALMVAESQRAFREQKHGADAWDARAAVNVYGIIADFAQGRSKPPQRRFERRPALSDTGRLRRSIAYRTASQRSVIVGSNLPYAATHQYGGRIESEVITPSLRRALWKWLKKQDAGLKRQLGWLLNKKFQGERLSGEVEARPFVGVTRRTKRDILETVGVVVWEVKP